MEELRSYLERLIETFRDQPERLRAAVHGFDEAKLHEPLQPGGWSPHQVVAHVVATGEHAMLPRLRRILEEDTPTLPNWDEGAWMETEYDPSSDLDELIDRWKSQRAARAPRLLTDDLTIWNRTGVHPVQRERTLLWWLEYSVNHVRDHLQQLGAD